MYDEITCTNRSTSRLYHLQPIDIGTPDVESFEGYIKRLAVAHCVSVGNLIRMEILPEINKSYITTYHFIQNNTRIKIGFSSDITKAFIRILEEKTNNDCLSYLTMNKWEEFLCSKYMYRKNHAWCPICYEESLQLGRTVYEKLIWSFNDIDICKKHQVRLMQKCPYCDREFSGFDSLSRVDYCDYCKAWLGLKKYSDNQRIYTDEEWQNWVYDNIGQLLAFSSNLKKVDNLFSNNLQKLINTTNLSQRELEKLLKLSHKALYYWVCGSKPRIDSLLNLSLRLGVNVTDILTKDINISLNGLNNIGIEPIKRNLKTLDVAGLKKTINIAINSIEGLSTAKLATTIGVSDETIRRHFPDEVMKIKENYNKYLEKCKLERVRQIKNTMKSLKESNIFPSRTALKHSFGKNVIFNDYYTKVWIGYLEELGYVRDDYNNSNGCRKSNDSIGD